MSVILIIFESLALAASCSLDAFAASFAYGGEGIRIPWRSALIIDVICSSVLGLSLLFGSAVRSFLPPGFTVGASFAILFVIGCVKLLDGVTKSIILHHNSKNAENLNKELRFSIFNFSFILNLYANPVDADVNVDKIISPKEAAALAVSLSLDGLAAGFGAALGSSSVTFVILASLAATMLAVFSGSRLGARLTGKLPFNMSCLSGAILIALAIMKLL